MNLRAMIPSGPSRVAAVAGLMSATALPPFEHTGPLMVPALALLFAAVLRAERSGRTAWAFGLAHQATVLHWLFFLGDAAPIASRTLVPAAAGAAILYASVFAAVWGWAVGLIRRRFGVAAGLVVAPLLWTCMDWLRGVGELSFPWCLTGAAVLTTRATGLVAAAGELGVGAWIALAASALAAFGLRDRGAPAFAALGAAVLGAIALGALSGTAETEAGSPEIRIAVVQPDVALEDKWDAAKRDSTIVPYTRLSGEAAAAGADLLVWAETAVPAYLRYDRPLLRWVRGLADSLAVPIFLGHPELMLGPEGERLRFNGASLYDADGVRRGGYRKHHLLPFGEVMPFQALIPALGRVDLGQAEWDVGAPPGPISSAVGCDSLAFAALICYEAIMPGLARDAVNAGAELLVTITNDGWFGFTAGPVQHAAMARLRAAECGVPVVRCANNGRSFLADARGRELAALELGERAFAVADLRPGPGGTAFLRYGHRPVWAGLGLWTLTGLFLVRRGARHG